MRRLIVLSMISLDGVMQAPGGSEEDRSGGFEYGGWTMPYFSKTGMDIVIEQISRASDLLLGRKTYDIFANYWPKADPKNPIAAAFNKATKYVATRSSLRSSWEKTVRIEGDLAEGVRTLKAEVGPELQVHGSGNMIQTYSKMILSMNCVCASFQSRSAVGSDCLRKGRSRWRSSSRNA